MKTGKDLANVLEPISWLLGEWHGKGTGGFPTHDPFEYVDFMNFKIVGGFQNEPLIHFEEIANLSENGKETFKHWETGYFKPTQDGRIEFYICHNTGRIEITYGTYDELNIEKKRFKISFKSDSIRNDEGTRVALKSRRKFTYRQGILEYNLDMSTSDVVEIRNHLKAKLTQKRKNVIGN